MRVCVCTRLSGKLEEARPLIEEALQGRKEHEKLGKRHPHTLTSITCMGLLLQDMGQLEEARLLLEEALQAKKETLGDRHWDTRNTMRPSSCSIRVSTSTCTGTLASEGVSPVVVLLLLITPTLAGVSVEVPDGRGATLISCLM